MSRLDELNTQVTAAIVRLEDAEREVSRLEEEIAKLTSPASIEGRIARCGAVRAAIAGRDERHARELAQRFLAEDGTDKKLIRELAALFSQA